MLEQLNRIVDALQNYAQQNHQPAVEEPANDFERFVNEWYDLQQLHEKIKDLIKPLAAAERKGRDGISESLVAFFGDGLKEGVNNYEMSNDRKLKYNHSIGREVDTAQIAVAREAYAKAGGTVAFDDLLRVKYELDKRSYNKLGAKELKAVSRMLVTKPKAATLEVD